MMHYRPDRTSETVCGIVYDFTTDVVMDVNCERCIRTVRYHNDAVLERQRVRDKIKAHRRTLDRLEALRDCLDVTIDEAHKAWPTWNAIHDARRDYRAALKIEREAS